jgi:GH25 family lysozyme M1 (1,4-beta-N-acetylmuramidase)
VLRGLDASSVQGAIPYSRLDRDLAFIILKAQQGNDGFDSDFERNMKGALAAGFEPFAYCYVYPLAHIDPKAQAKLFVDRVYRYPQLKGRPLFIDCEWPEVVAQPPRILKGWREWKCNPAQISAYLRELFAEVERLSGVTPILYTYDYWWAAIRDGAPAYGFPTGADVSWAAHYPLWMAWYVKGWPKLGDAPRIPRPWSSWLFWQFDGNGGLRLPNGVDADFCVFNGDAVALKALASNEAVQEAALVDLNTVRGVQERLRELGFDPGPVDGLRGPKTNMAVAAFQAARGLVVDGVIGPATRAALG